MGKWISRIMFGFAAVIAAGMTYAQTTVQRATMQRTTARHATAPRFKRLSSLVLNTTRGGAACNNSNNCFQSCTGVGGTGSSYLVFNTEWDLCGFSIFGSCDNSHTVICTSHFYSGPCKSPFNVIYSNPIACCN